MVTEIFSWGERWNVLVEWNVNIPSFTEWKYSYHCTNKNIHYLYIIDDWYNINNNIILIISMKQKFQLIVVPTVIKVGGTAFVSIIQRRWNFHVFYNI
jgi:hypothetical protein